MKDRAQVRITLESELDGEKQTQVFTGEWFRKDRTVYVRYDESGDHGAVRTVVRWREGELSVKRHGDVESEQTFVAGERRAGQYESAHARFQLETETKLMWMQYGDMSEVGPVENRPKPTLPMLLEWHYTLWVEGQPSGAFVIRLQAEEQ
ncbi:DUF1934 domain-containing protein [Paenibacillus sp. sptzw28]|uniref:DUF1934 domain-containing protein n=1 Tax=Paenibacillus sp. sptzw28 TaxID=715179 RepID=UPI001C6E1BF8|nr:DUF1934 domain-containing protein [Paenibacillus sp. sptzw28]QYR21579.1 DUF1934 domain-containing protein [Paenibacillus sp. sptzw28]